MEEHLDGDRGKRIGGIGDQKRWELEEGVGGNRWEYTWDRFGLR